MPDTQDSLGGGAQWVGRAARGATTAAENSREAIISATRELLGLLLQVNQIHPERIVSVFFTASPDLNAAFPAAGARGLGLEDAAILCAQEIDVAGAPPRCIRVLIQWNDCGGPRPAEHIYLGQAAVLRPDRTWPRQRS